MFGHNIHEESPMHREFIIQNVHELHGDTDTSKSTPFEQVRFCQIHCVRDTPQNRRTKKIITLNLKEKETTQSGLVQVHVFMVTDAEQHHLGKPTRNGTPSTQYVTERNYQNHAIQTPSSLTFTTHRNPCQAA